MSHSRRLFLTASAALGLAACGGTAGTTGTGSTAASGSAGAGPASTAAGGGAPKKVVVGVAPTTSNAGFYLAQDNGYFKEQGLDVTLKEITTGSQAIPLLLNGEINFTVADLGSIGLAFLQGIKVKMVASATHFPKQGPSTDALVVKDPNLKTPKDLNGKTMAVSSLKGAPAVVLQEAVAKAGGDASTLKMVEIPQASQVAAIAAGRVDGAELSEPFIVQAVEQGLRIIVRTGEYACPGAMQAGWIGNEDFMSKNADTTKRFISVMEKANADVVADIEKGGPKVRAIFGRTTKIDPKDLEKMVLPAYVAGPVGEQSAQQMLDLLAKWKLLTQRVKASSIIYKA